METWYKITPYSIEVETVEVVKATKEFVFICEDNWQKTGKRIRRQAKESSYDKFFPSELEAINALLYRTKSRLSRLALDEAAEIQKLEDLRKYHARIV